MMPCSSVARRCSASATLTSNGVGIRSHSVEMLTGVVEMAVVGIGDIQWNVSAIGGLIIPDEKKEVVLALAETQTRESEGLAFDDVVEGKGQGLNMLLQSASLSPMSIRD